MGNRSFARWSAPFVGVGAGIWIAFYGARKEGHPVTTELLLMFSAVGFFGGLVVLIVDPPQSHDGENRGTFFGRTSAVLSVLCSWMPFIGLIVGAIAVFLNRRVRGWPKIISWFSTAVGLIIATAVLHHVTVSARTRPSPPGKRQPVQAVDKPRR